MKRQSPEEFLAAARRDNPGIRYALRKSRDACDGAVLGAWCDKAGGFIPVAIESAGGSGQWLGMPAVYLEINGVAVGIEPENWIEP